MHIEQKRVSYKKSKFKTPKKRTSMDSESEEKMTIKSIPLS